MARLSQLTRDALVVWILLVSPATAADIQTWVSPAYKASPPESKEMITIENYPYRWASYDPPILIPRIPPQAARYDSPEYSFISRVSAMMSSNYNSWLETWDEDGRAFTLHRDAEKGNTPDAWVKQWDQVFGGARMLMVRRVLTGKYVVIIYKMRSIDGRSESTFELPAVLRQSEGRWYSTLDLRNDPLLPASPWVSGRDSVEVTVR